MRMRNNLKGDKNEERLNNVEKAPLEDKHKMLAYVQWLGPISDERLSMLY
mgnify:FL=1